MWQFWLIVAGVCFVIEAFTVGFFVFWFGVGALVALALSFLTQNIWLQAVAFIVSSSLLLLLTKPIVKKFIKNTNDKPTNFYSVIGKEGIVLEEINSINSTGTVKINGELWSATADSNIPKDTKIKVIGVNGVKVKVEKINTISTITNS